ncbi:MAG: hypothetical protein HKL80_07895, partial [Acidimicrobiales bacterium]|nr:hypothetical protein [Acidimicrobiales bacterium]
MTPGNNRDIGALAPVRRNNLRKRRQRRNRLVATVFVVAVVVALAAFGGLYLVKPTTTTSSTLTSKPKTSTTSQPEIPTWRTAWGSAMAFAPFPATNVTIRVLTALQGSGTAVRVRISNEFGNAPLVVGAAASGISAGGDAVVVGSQMPLTFSGLAYVTIPIGSSVVSDPINMAVSFGETLETSLYLPSTDKLTSHYYGQDTPITYYTRNNAGNVTADTTGSSFTGSNIYAELVDAVDVYEPTGRPTIVALGDSITDGFHSALAWTSVLEARIDSLPLSERSAVIPEAITANTLTNVVPNYSIGGGGPSGEDRFIDDVTSLSDVKYLIVLLGTNDLFFGATAPEVIAGYQSLIQEAHKAGITVIGATLTPRGGSDQYVRTPWNAQHQLALNQVNHWILTSHAFDDVVDLNRLVANVYNGSCQPDVFFPGYDSTDHLHPNPAGQIVIGNAFPTSDFGLPPTPIAQPAIGVTPTPGCDGN